MNAKELIQKNPLKSAALLLSLGLIGFGVYRHFDLPAIEEEQERLSRQATLSRGNVMNSSTLNEQLETLRTANKSVAERLAKASDLAGNTQYFYRIENETGVREISLSPVAAKGGKNAAPKGHYQTVTFSLVVEGKFNQVVNLMDRLEGGAWFGRIASLTLRHTTNADTRADPQLTATITVDLLASP